MAEGQNRGAAQPRVKRIVNLYLASVIGGAVISAEGELASASAEIRSFGFSTGSE